MAVEPRVMQVLVVLARSAGQVVGRQQLINQCWDGRIVGDDSINQAVAKLRQLAARCNGQFAVETIPRVGFRLIETDRAATPDEPPIAPLPAAAAPTSRRALILASVAAGTVIAGGGAALLFPSRPDKRSQLALAYYRQGIATRGQGFGAQYEQAVGYFRQAVEADPGFADAWGALAWSYRTLLATPQRPDYIRVEGLAKSAAHRALELDPANPDAQLTLLLLLPNYQRWAEVERGCRRILAQHPAHGITQFQLGYILTQTGRWRDSIAAFTAVSNREPTWPMASYRLFEALRSSGRVEEADARIESAMKLAPRNGDFWSSQIHHLLLTGRHDDAVALLNDKDARPDDDAALVTRERMIVEAYAGTSTAKRKQVIDRFLREARTGGTAAVLDAAINMAMLGDPDAAFLLLEGFYLGRGPWGDKSEPRAVTHPLFGLEMAALRSDRRFTALLQETGLERYWAETHTQPDYRRFQRL